jgi:hypothetical protein
VKLNSDGTPVKDNAGKVVEVYTDKDIESFARAWTGFDRKLQGAPLPTEWILCK